MPASIKRIRVLLAVGVATLYIVAPAATITRGPYIQNLTPNTATIVWSTDVACSSRIDAGLTMAYGITVEDPSLVLQHALTLTSLQCAQLYHYQVSGDGLPLTADLAFHSGKDSSFNSFMFVAYGDTRRDSLNPGVHATVAARIRTIDPEFVMHSGDLVNNGEDATLWNNEFFTPAKDFLSRSCLFSAIGNHEGAATNYLSYFHFPSGSSGTERYYSFDYANAHFIVLDTNTAYTTGSVQYNWLVSDLQANSSKDWTFVAFHYPPYSSGSGHGSNLTVRDVFATLFTQYGVDMVFNGHDHIYERGFANNVRYIVTGGGGAPLHNVGTNWWTQSGARSYHCCEVTVSGKNLAVRVVRPDGTIVDSFGWSVPVTVSRFTVE